MKEKTKKLVKRLSIIGGAIVSVLIVLAIVLSLTACSLKNSEQENGANTYPNVNAQFGFGPNVVFTFSETTVNEETNSVSKTITATVLPEDAPDKTVDWAIHWSTNNEGEDAVLSDYISITPLEDGSNVATVTCYKGFEGSTFMIWVKTRVGGFAKNCIVRYDGAPESLFIEYDGERYDTNYPTIMLNAGETYNFDLKLSNTLGAVGSKYGNFEIFGITATGKFNFIRYFDSYTTKVGYIDLSSREGYDDKGYSESFKNYISLENFFKCSIKNNTLTVETIANEKAFVYDNGNGFRLEYDSEYVDPNTQQVSDCIFHINITDTVSHKVFILNFDISSAVSGVSISDTEITF